MMSKLILLLSLLLTLSTYTRANSIVTTESSEWREKKFKLVVGQLQAMIQDKLPDLHKLIDAPKRLKPQGLYLHTKPELCQAHLIEALKYLYGKKSKTISNESAYGLFIEHLRSSISTRYYRMRQFKAYEDELVDNIQKLAMLLYHGVHIHEYLDKLWKTIANHGGYEFTLSSDRLQIRSGAPASFDKENLLEIRARLETLVPIYQGIKTGKSALGVKLAEKTRDTLFGGVTWLSFDPASMGNIPYVKFWLKRSNQHRMLTYIRMPTPTLNSNKSTVICPEFKAYLGYLKNRGLQHLYLNYQDNIRPELGKIKSTRQFVQALGVGNESFRAEAVELLAEGLEFKDTALVLTFSKDSRFYKQSRKDEKGLMSTRTFIARYLRAMFDVRSEGFYVPPSWRKKGSQQREDVRSYLEQIHRWFFYGKGFLDRNERRDFIEISYLFIGDYASRNVYSVNQTCKTGIDRAGAANTMSFLMSLIMFNHSSDYDNASFQQLLSSFESMLFSDAIMAKKREIKRSRLLRFQTAAIRMLDSLIENPKLLDELASVLGDMQPFLSR